MATHGNNSLNDCRITSNAFQIRTLAALSILESFLGIVSGYRRLLLQCKMHVRLGPGRRPGGILRSFLFNGTAVVQRRATCLSIECLGNALFVSGKH
jgi:hypothetical protein